MLVLVSLLYTAAARRAGPRGAPGAVYNNDNNNNNNILYLIII